MKAWLDLSQRKNRGETIDSKDIKKHRNDVIRLVVNIDSDILVSIPDSIKEDAIRFLDELKNKPVDLKSLNIKNITNDEIIERIETCFGIWFFVLCKEKTGILILFLLLIPSGNSIAFALVMYTNLLTWIEQQIKMNVREWVTKFKRNEKYNCWG